MSPISTLCFNQRFRLLSCITKSLHCDCPGHRCPGSQASPGGGSLEALGNHAHEPETYANPYADVTVAVTFTSPSGKKYDTYGFWDGGDTFKIRFMFPPELNSTWSWKTTCSNTADEGLHNQTGSVVVTPYRGANPLYKRGYLKVSTDKRYLTYADGTAFLWLGDTAWAAMIASTFGSRTDPEGWENYILKRKAQRFNVIQVHAKHGWVARTKDRRNRPPFITTSGSPYTGSGPLMWNPAYWQGVEQKVQYANDQGLLVFFTAVRQSGPHGPAFPETDPTQVHIFARNLAARLMGSFVVYSPVADDVWTSLADVAGNALRAATPLHLITGHPRFLLSSAQAFHGKSYTDFTGLQTGWGWTYDPYVGEPHEPFDGALAVQQAIDWPLAFYHNALRKPVLNLEAAYDGLALQSRDATRYKRPYPTRLPRSTAYLSMLSGARGFTYGNGSIWNWGMDVPWDGSSWSFTAGLDQPSATHMQYMYDMFTGLRWWALEPQHQLVQQQSSDILKKIVFAKTSDNTLAVAYLPANPSVSLRMHDFPTPMAAIWFNPVTNARQAVASLVLNAETQTIMKPSGWSDAVLILTQPSFNTVATPTISPRGGSFTSSVTVALANATRGATIRYTTNGTTPTTRSTQYSGPFTLTNTATVQAKAWKAGMTESGGGSATFTKSGTMPVGNLVQNPGFEIGAAAWSLSSKVQVTAGGANGSANAVRITADGTMRSASQTITGVTPGVTYTFEAWTRSQDIEGAIPNHRPQLALQWRNASNANLGNPVYLYGDQGTTPWRYRSTTVHAPAEAARARITVYTWGGQTEGNAYFDAIQLKP